MNDFDYDVMQKKRIASGDRHRKRGSKSKYCGLPSDHLTQAQWKKKNGKVKVMKLSEPMSWEQFKAMPSDLQKEYVQKLAFQFHCRKADLCELFGVNVPTISRKMREIGIDPALFPKGRRVKDEDLYRFRKWVNGDFGEVRETSASQTTSATATSTTALSILNRADSFEVEWSGHVNLEEVFELIGQFAKKDPVRLRISVQRQEVTDGE